jgi:hypothetical protein
VPEPPHHFELIEEAILKFLSARTDYGRLVGLRAVQVLQENAPYPGDNGESDPERFCMYQISQQEHIIMDCVQMVDTIISTEYLLDSYFEIDKWYGQQREQAFEEMGPFLTWRSSS